MRSSDMSTRHFYKEMDFSSMRQMSLPVKLIANLRGGISEIKLKGPSGVIWQVKVAKSAEKFVLRSGWKEFLLANDTKENDTLIFNYIGDFTFQVLIFQPNGCERPSSFFAKKKGGNVREMNHCFVEEEEEEEEGSDEHNTHQHEIITSGSSTNSENCTEESFTSAETPRRPPKKYASTSKNKKERNMCERPKTEVSSMYIVRHLHLTNTQNRKALQLAREVQRENPHFVCLINRCCLHPKRFLVSIPTKFADDHLPKETQEIALHYDGRKWYPRYIWNQGRKRIASEGWKSFALDNDLQEDDICVFELLKDQKNMISFRVHIAKN